MIAGMAFPAQSVITFPEPNGRMPFNKTIERSNQFMIIFLLLLIGIDRARK
jgi:hypothetical protein